MTATLASCQAKVRRASENIRNLDGEVRSYLSADPRPYRIEREQDNTAKKYIFRATCGPLPERFAVLAGEVLHNLRSSLDHLVSALVEKNGRTTTKNHHFPISDTQKKFEDACKSGALDGISASALDHIRSVQPFTRAQPSDADLAILHSYNIEDKHRRPLVTCTLACIGSTIRLSCDGPGTIGGMSPPHAHKIGDLSTTVFSIDLVEPIPNFDIKADFDAAIALEDFGLTQLKPIVPGLSQLRDRVAETISRLQSEL